MNNTAKKNNDGDKSDILQQILSGKDATKKVNVGGEDFTFKYAVPAVVRCIDVTLHQRFPGIDINHVKELPTWRAYATLDYVVTEAPEWWDNLESCEFTPDDRLISELYRRYLQFCKEIRKTIDKRFDRSRGGDTEKPNSNEKTPMVNGPFSGITNG